VICRILADTCSMPSRKKALPLAAAPNTAQQLQLLQSLAHDLDTVTQAAHAASTSAREQFSSRPEGLVAPIGSPRKER
jgi:hypothetical protein